MLVLAHLGHFPVSKWPTVALVALIGAGVVLVVAIIWLVWSERSYRRRVETSVRQKARDKLATQAFRRRTVFMAIVAVAILVAGVAFLSKPDPAGPVAGGPTPEGVGDDDREFPFRFAETSTTGSFTAVVENKTKFIVFAQCQIGIYDAAGNLITERTYPSETKAGVQKQSHLYTTRVLIKPHDERRFGADVHVSAPAARFEGGCDPRQIPKDVLKQVTPEGRKLLHPDSR